jgi:hypothetical protein
MADWTTAITHPVLSIPIINGAQFLFTAAATRNTRCRFLPLAPIPEASTLDASLANVVTVTYPSIPCAIAEKGIGSVVPHILSGRNSEAFAGFRKPHNSNIKQVATDQKFEQRKQIPQVSSAPLHTAIANPDESALPPGRQKRDLTPTRMSRRAHVCLHCN